MGVSGTLRVCLAFLIILWSMLCLTGSVVSIYVEIRAVIVGDPSLYDPEGILPFFFAFFSSLEVQRFQPLVRALNAWTIVWGAIAGPLLAFAVIDYLDSIHYAIRKGAR